LAATLGSTGALASDSSFAMQSMDKGYLLAEAAKIPTGKCGGGMCGANMKAKMAEGACGAGKCSVETMDSNKDGKIDKAEFVKYHEAMFDKLDTNKDGAIDQGEMAKWKEGVCAASKVRSGKCGGMK
jgi:uncharacterized low-complexity protein